MSLRCSSVQSIRSHNRNRYFECLEPRTVLAANPIVTELMASNDLTIADGDGNSSDWIEIYNAGDEVADLTGWHLTDDAEEPTKWTFPPTTLEPDSYLVVFASGHSIPNYVDAGGNLHTTFRLSAGGEYAGLVEPAGTIKHHFAPGYPVQVTDVSFGVAMNAPGEGPAVDLTQEGYFEVPTPGFRNGSIRSGVTQANVAFSRESGFITDSESVELITTNPAHAIRYTLDGTIPTQDSPLYTQPIVLDATTQIRARVVEPDRVMGPVATGSFLRLGEDVVNYSSELPIMVIDNFGAGDVPNSG